MLTRTKETRPHDAADYMALKSATKLCTELAGATLADVCRRTRLDAATLSRSGNADHSNFVPLDVCADLDALAGEPVILRALAAIEGYDLVPLQPSQAMRNLAVEAGHAALETGQLVATLIDSASDGKLTPREAKTVIAEANDVERIVAGIKTEMHGVVAGVGK